MSETIVIQIITTFGSLVAGLFGILKPMLNQVVIRMEKRFDTIEKQYQKMSNDLNDFKFETIKQYASRAELENQERSNTASHATMHGRIDDMSHRVTVIETVQKQCSGCNSK